MTDVPINPAVATTGSLNVVSAGVPILVGLAIVEATNELMKKNMKKINKGKHTIQDIRIRRIIG